MRFFYAADDETTTQKTSEDNIIDLCSVAGNGIHFRHRKFSNNANFVVYILIDLFKEFSLILGAYTKHFFQIKYFLMFFSLFCNCSHDVV